MQPVRLMAKYSSWRLNKSIMFLSRISVDLMIESMISPLCVLFESVFVLETAETVCLCLVIVARCFLLSL
jgi:hypothetical protein